MQWRVASDEWLVKLRQSFAGRRVPGSRRLTFVKAEISAIRNEFDLLFSVNCIDF